MSTEESKIRAPRTLVINDDLAGFLGALLERENADPTGHVNLDVLHPIEVTLGFQFNDDLLAAFAAPLRSLAADISFGLSEVVGHCGELRELRARGDLIGIAADDDGIWVIDKRTTRNDAITTTIGRARGMRGRVEVTGKQSLLEFLSEVTDIAPQRRGPPFVATLHRKAPMADTPGRAVTHGKFGPGTAFSETGTGPTRKVTCDFPSVGLKVIQARFLTFLDEA